MKWESLLILWSSIWSWLDYFNSSVNTSVIKKRKTLEGEKTHRRNKCHSEKEIRQGKWCRPEQKEWVTGLLGTHMAVRTEASLGQDQRTTPANIWWWIKLSFKWKNEIFLEPIRAGPGPGSCNWIWEMIWGCNLCWWRNRTCDTGSFL